jgi:signal transduction histidine kinase
VAAGGGQGHGVTDGRDKVGSWQAELRLLRTLFPFFVTITADGRLGAVGERWRTCAPEIDLGARFDDLFAIARPIGLAGADDLGQHLGDVFLLRLKQRPGFELRGQFFAGGDHDAPGTLHFAGGPWLTKLAAMAQLGLAISDFPPHDPRGDLLVMMQVQESQLAELRQLTGNLQERIRQQAQLEGQIRQIQKMELVGRFAGGMAHNFNNILMAIRSYADLALTELTAGDPLHEWIEQICTATDHAASLTRGLLTMSRQQPVRIQALAVAAEFAEIQKLVEPLLGANVRLSVRVAPDVTTLQADSNSLKQIFMNLVLNARDAMPKGGAIAIEVAHRVETPPGGSEPRAYVAVTVTDSGTGMDDRTKANLFEPFFTTKASGKGVGLGLSTVYGLVQQLGGAIRVDSELGMGTTFHVLLPDVAATAAPTPALHELARMAGEHVLLVDDEAHVRRPLERVLQNAGFRVTAAANADEALAALRSGPRCQILLTDVVMPGMSGTQLAAAVEQEFGALPVLFISGHTDDARLRSGHLPPHHRFLPKPFAADELVATLRTLLTV